MIKISRIIEKTAKNGKKEQEMNYITETLKTPVAGEYDVIVVGGGPAGSAAAISAARKGMKTLLIEKAQCLGGMWTSGFINPVFDAENKNDRSRSYRRLSR